MKRYFLVGLMFWWTGWAPVSAQLIRPVVGTDELHAVQEGEDLYTLSHGASLGMEHLSFANRIPIKLELTPGQQVVLPTRRILPANPPANGLVLNIPERGMFLFKNGRYVKFYPVTVGRLDFKTPRGNFRIIEKVKDPTWVPPAWAGLGKIAIGPGRANPLGDRWIGLSAPRVGIHGTQSPYSIGDFVSHGCLRMYPDMILEMFDKVRVGMPVRIEYETFKLGKDPETGKIVFASFPDIYHLSDPRREARRLFPKVGLRADPATVGLVASTRGMALDPSGERNDPVVVKLDERILTLASSPIVHAGKLWIPSDVLESLGLILDAQEGSTFESFSRAGKTYFETGPILEHFGVTYRWAQEADTLFLYNRVADQQE